MGDIFDSIDDEAVPEDEYNQSGGEFDSPKEETRQAEAQQEQALNQAMRSMGEEVDEDAELAEIDKVVGKIVYYKKIVQEGGVIQEDGTPEASEVNAEISLWAKQQMKRLLMGGGRSEVAPVVIPAQFTDDEAMFIKKLYQNFDATELAFLKSLAAKLSKQGYKPPEPVVNRLQKTPSPAAAAPAPAVKKFQGTKKQEAAPVQQQTQARQQAKVPAKKAQAPSPYPVAKKIDEKGTLDLDAIETGVIFKDPNNGRLYRMVPHPELDNKRLKIHVSNQVRPTNAIPMPSQQQQVILSEHQAQQSVAVGAASKIGKSSSLLGAALHAIKSE